jgi:hypothetical protein
MIVQESLQGRIPEDMNYISRMSEKLTETLNEYQNIHNSPMSNSLNSIILGILLQYLIIASDVQYHKLSLSDQESYIQNLINQLRF